MAITRRQILTFPLAGGLLTILGPLQAGTDAARLGLAIVPDAAAMPRFSAGQMLVVDTGLTAFVGAGIYFYPAWGTPRPWHVSMGASQMLEFRNPGTGQLAWIQSRSMNPAFAGRLAYAAQAGVTSFPLLQVPLLA